MASFELIAVARTFSSKDPEGEDRVCTFGSGPGPTGVVVCDGVGMIAGSAQVADEASALGVALLSGREVGPAIWNLDRRVEHNFSADRQGATTMAVVCAEEGGVVGHLLLGNGSIVEVVPMEVEPGKVRLLWTSIVLPQMGGNDGRPALRSFIPSNGTPLEAEKGIRKLPSGTSRLYLACSDGFLSEEDRLEGPAPDGTVWRQVPKSVADLFELLTTAWQDLLGSEPEAAAAKLGDLIELAVHGPKSRQPLDDDTTVGALLMRPTSDGRKGGEGRPER